MKNISTLERISVKNEKNATILELPNEIDLSDFLDQSRYRDHFRLLKYQLNIELKTNQKY